MHRKGGIEMDKRIYALGMLTMVGLLAAACGQVGSGSDTASTYDTANQSSTAESLDTSSLESTVESSDMSETNELLADPYFAIFEGKNYVLKYNYTTFTGEKVEGRSMTVAVDGAAKAIRISGDDTDTTYLTLDGQAYEADNLNKTVTIKESPDAGSDTSGIIAVPPFKDAGITYAGSGEQDGLVYEEYYATNGDRMFYYFEDTVLKRIRSASGENTTTMDVLEVNETVTPDYFVIPDDYERLP